ncbi:MAG: hypothetical protein JNK05_09590 [Myxococcales bacterium]|nr:hypothetical protein [Myxococcales bacterium]
MGETGIPEPTPGTPTGQAAIDAMKAEIGAIDPNKVGIYNIEALYAATTILRALPAIKAQLPLLERLFDFDRKNVDQLETYAHGLIHANAQVIAHSPETSNFDELAVQARALREEFLRVADLLVGRRQLAQSAVDKIREGQGNLDLISDVSALLVIVKEHQDGALVRHEDVALAEKLVAELPTAYAQHSGKDPKLEPLLQLRRVVGAVVIFAYSEIVAALRYVRRRQEDADTIAPSIYVPRGPGKKDAAEAANPAPAPSPAPTPANPLVPSDNPFDGTGNKR